MNEVSPLQSLGQVSASESGKVFRDFIRGDVREMISEVNLGLDVIGANVHVAFFRGITLTPIAVLAAPLFLETTDDVCAQSRSSLTDERLQGFSEITCGDSFEVEPRTSSSIAVVFRK